MKQLINKSALVAEIERLKTIYNDDENIHHIAKYNILVDILSFLDTIEVKDVDLEKEIDKWWCSYKRVKPATKKQRDLLFRKMKEAGYEWIDYEKELVCAKN